MKKSELNKVVSVLVKASKKKFGRRAFNEEEVNDFLVAAIAINFPSATEKEAIRDAAIRRILGARDA